MQKVKNDCTCLIGIMFLILALLTGCGPGSGAGSKLFTLLPSDHTNIEFSNRLEFKRDFNITNYQNFYNGGGVGIGDVNNDGLPDIYLTANMQPNKLYINKGELRFEDITRAAGVEGKRGWSTGVALADVNGDGWLDIYVCNAGMIRGDDRKNELFINNGNGTFNERAEAFGLADPGLSTHAAFFDYDRDGDLDAYIVNNSHIAGDEISDEQRQRSHRDTLGGDRLMRNDDGYFTDVTEQAGIYSSIIAYGLGVSVSDLNKDGWQDMYVSNDFFERDYIYMNNGDGTFREAFTEMIRSGSVSSMGADIVDFTGDGYPEIFVTEMLQEDEIRQKTNMDFNTWSDYQFYVKDGYHHQFSRNVFQEHLGVIPGKGIRFREVGRMAGIEATDWSWAANIFDINNDGRNDLFVSNGLYHDILNKDYANYMAKPRKEFFVRRGNKFVVDINKVINAMPSHRIPNYAYKGGPDLSFSKKTIEWGLADSSFSNGAAYGDLDNDGDLDLVVNNVNMPSFVYRNQAREFYPDHNYLKVELKGEDPNTLAVGAKVTLKANGRLFYLEQMPQRGFQSSVDPRLNFGLGAIPTIDTLQVDWPGGRRTILTGIRTNQTLELKESDAVDVGPEQTVPEREPFFTDVTDRFPLNYRHVENEFNDFKKNPLLFHMASTEGPKAATADVNGDGLQDLFVGGAKGSPAALFIQEPSGTYRSTNLALFRADRESEDLGCTFFDADRDGDPDLYVASGGNEEPTGSGSYLDRLYFNDGKGNFTKSRQRLPAGQPESTSVVRSSDFDADGDLDLFVGMRIRPGLPGIPGPGFLLQNNGRGQFRNVTPQAAPVLRDLGMITGAVWSDYDADGDPDLVITGRWMPIKLFENDGTGYFTDQTDAAGLGGTSGWWNTIEAADIDRDGDTDFVVGNLGRNSRFRATSDKPMYWYIKDIDRSGTIDHIITAYNGTKSYPFIAKDELVQRLPYLKNKYFTHASYAGQTVNEIFTKAELDGSIVHRVTMAESVLLRNNGDGTLGIEPLPRPAQVSPVYAILIEDLDADGKKDILLGGNLHNVKPDIGRYDASYGVFLKGNRDGNLQVLEARYSGLALDGEVRDFVRLETPGGKPKILVVRNDDTIQVLEF